VSLKGFNRAEGAWRSARTLPLSPEDFGNHLCKLFELRLRLKKLVIGQWNGWINKPAELCGRSHGRHQTSKTSIRPWLRVNMFRPCYLQVLS
jgi:hypothetical protein